MISIHPVNKSSCCFTHLLSPACVVTTLSLEVEILYIVFINRFVWLYWMYAGVHYRIHITIYLSTIHYISNLYTYIQIYLYTNILLSNSVVYVFQWYNNQAIEICYVVFIILRWYWELWNLWGFVWCITIWCSDKSNYYFGMCVTDIKLVSFHSPLSSVTEDLIESRRGIKYIIHCIECILSLVHQRANQWQMWKAQKNFMWYLDNGVKKSLGEPGSTSRPVLL